MRARYCLVVPGLLLAGCGTEPKPGAPIADPVPVVVDVPAAARGGACALLDFAVIEELTGARFDVAAVGGQGRTQTCVVRAEAAPRPDLVLSVTPSDVDAAGFAADVVPRGGKTMSGLGRGAYRLTVTADRDRGPGAEVGWLTADGRIISLRYTFAGDADRERADEFGPKLVDLAKRVDADRGR